MMFDRMRVYDAGRFHDAELPDWYREAQSLSQTERIDWHCALERVLDCEYTLLTEDGTASTGLEIRFWPSEIERHPRPDRGPPRPRRAGRHPEPDRLAAVPLEIPRTPDRNLRRRVPCSQMQGKIANALIAWARHGEGSHVDRETGLSRIDLDNDRDRRRAQQARAAMERERQEGRA